MLRVGRIVAVTLAAALAAPPCLAADPYGGEGGNRAMAQRLARLFADSDPTVKYTMNPQRAELIREELSWTEDIREQVYLRFHLASELLNAGSTQDAIRELEELQRMTRENRIDMGERNGAFLRRHLIIAYFRLGEQQNCLENHTTESCLLPIRAWGIHRNQQGSRRAMDLLREQLEAWPGDLEARWLLNVAAMTVGEYPQGVPEPWLLDPALFRSEAETGRFMDIAAGLGLDVDDLAGGTIVEDFDRDGYLDVMVSSSRSTGPLRYFRNARDGTFRELTSGAGLSYEVSALNITSADYDNDGYVDVLMLRGGWLGAAGELPKSLLRNNGDGTFTDVTERAGLLGFHPTQTATWLDFDGDGRLDLFIGNETGGDFFEENGTGKAHPAELFRNNGDGTFTDCAATVGVAVTGYVKGVTSGDYDNDGRVDLYISRRGQPNILLRNWGPAEGGGGCAWIFRDVTREAGVAEPLYSFTTWFWDYDNDGWEDLFVSGYRARHAGDVAADYLGLEHPAALPKLYRNNGDGTFSDRTIPARLNRVLLTMGGNFGDIDSDGWLDFYVGTGDPSLAMLVPNRMFRNDQGRAFQDVTTSAGVGHLQKGHGVSFADLDNDGDQDIYHCLGGAYWGDGYRDVLFENPGHGNHWLTLKLEGADSVRSSLGARITVVVRTADGTRSIRRTVGTGGSFGVSPLRQEIGLGDALRIERVEIRWPASGRTQIIENLEMDRFYSVREDQPTVTAVDLLRLDLSREDAIQAKRHHHEIPPAPPRSSSSGSSPR